MTDKYVPGEHIRITVNATVQGQPSDDTLEYQYPTALGTCEGVVVLDDSPVTIERVAPAEWPPRQGDLWRDRYGHLHFAASYCPDYDNGEDSEGIDADGIRVVLLNQGQDESCTPGATMHRPEIVNQRCGPLTLVHREEGQGR